MSTFTYRLFDETGALLYVGVSDGPRQRIAHHIRHKEWGDQIANWTTDEHPNRSAALLAEGVAIRDEGPRYNGNRGQVAYRPERPTSTAELAVYRVAELLTERQRSIAWLSETTGISSRVLTSRMEGTRARPFLINELWLIAKAFDVPTATLLAPLEDVA